MAIMFKHNVLFEYSQEIFKRYSAQLFNYLIAKNLVQNSARTMLLSFLSLLVILNNLTSFSEFLISNKFK